MWIRLMILGSFATIVFMMCGAIVDYRRQNHQRAILHVYILLVFLSETTALVLNLCGMHNTGVYNWANIVVDIVLLRYLNILGRPLLKNKWFVLVIVGFLFFVVANTFFMQRSVPLRSNQFWLGSFMAMLFIFFKIFQMLHSTNQPFMDHIDQKIMFVLLFYFMGTLVLDLSYQHVRSSYSGKSVLYVLYLTKYLIGVVSYFVLGLTLLKKGNHAKS